MSIIKIVLDFTPIIFNTNSFTAVAIDLAVFPLQSTQLIFINFSKGRNLVLSKAPSGKEITLFRDRLP